MIKRTMGICAECRLIPVPRTLDQCVACRKEYFRLKEQRRRAKNRELYNLKTKLWRQGRPEEGQEERKRKAREYAKQNRRRLSEKQKEQRKQDKRWYSVARARYFRKKYGAFGEAAQLLAEIARERRNNPEFLAIPEVRWASNRRRKYREIVSR